MNNLVFPLIAVGLSTFGIALLWLLRRRPRSMASDLEAFHRELDALGQARRAGAAPRNDQDRRAAPPGHATGAPISPPPRRMPPGAVPPQGGRAARQPIAPTPEQGGMAGPRPADGRSVDGRPQVVRGIAPVPDQERPVRGLRAVGPDDPASEPGPTGRGDDRRRPTARPGRSARGPSARRR